MTLKSDYLLKIKAWEKNNHYIPEGTRESHPRVHDLRHPRLGKPRRGLQIMDTQMGFPCPFWSVVIDSISRLFARHALLLLVPHAFQGTLVYFQDEESTQFKLFFNRFGITLRHSYFIILISYFTQ